MCVAEVTRVGVSPYQTREGMWTVEMMGVTELGLEVRSGRSIYFLPDTILKSYFGVALRFSDVT